VRRLAIVTAYVVVTAIMSWPFVNYDDFGGSSYGGDQRLIIWTLAWDNHALLSSDSLFASNLFYPATDSLRYNEHLFGVSLFSLPWTIGGASPVLAHHATWWLALVLNGLAAFALLYRFVRNGLAAFVGSLAFAYSFYVMLHAHGHLHQIWLWPLPLSLLLLERWFDAPSIRRLALWTAVLLLQILSSWYLAVFALIANAIFGGLLVAFGEAATRTGTSVRRAGPAKRTRLWHLVLATAIGVVCVYPFARHYVDITSSPAEMSGFTADVEAYVIPPQNTVIGGWWLANIDGRPRSIYGEQALFLGWTTLALALGGLGVLLRGAFVDRRAWLFAALAAAGVLLSFGPSLPLVGQTPLAPFNWLVALPGLDGVRVAARFAALATLGLAGLAAIACAALIGRLGSTGVIVVAVAAPLILFESFVVNFPAGKPDPHPVPAIYRTPQVQAARSLVSLPEYRARPDWFLGGDYLYYSTAHWRPIVNGFGRTEPAGHEEIVETVRRFPSSIPAMRELGLQYVVVHADRFPDKAQALLDAALVRSDCRLAARIGSDYLFEIF
jgi:hypothetical protein